MDVARCAMANKQHARCQAGDKSENKSGSRTQIVMQRELL